MDEPKKFLGFDKDALRVRLLLLVDRFGDRKVSKLAVLCQIPGGTLRKYIEAKSVPGTDILIQIANGTGVNIQWLATGEGPMFPGDTIPTRRDDEILIPFFDIRAAAGDGFLVPDYEAPLPPMTFKRAWLQALDISSTTHLQFLYAEGKSMEPTIRDGDFLMIDRDPDTISALRDGVWVIKEDSEVKVKRLQKTGGALRVISDDPTWPPYSLPMSDVGKTLIILGRVIWSGKRH